MFENKENFKKEFEKRVIQRYGRGVKYTSMEELFIILADMVKDYGSEDWLKTKEAVNNGQKKQLFYFSMEFLIGRLLTNNLMNLGVYDLYHVPASNSASDGYPVTVPPYDDGNFSTKGWPDGYADIDPMQSYRQLFDGDVTPVENYELIFSDLELTDRRIERVTKQLKTDRKLAAELDFLNRLKDHLESGATAASFPFADDERQYLTELPLLSYKPVIYVANVGEEAANGDTEDRCVNELRKVADREGAGMIALCCGLEAEIAELEPEEKQLFLEDMGIKEPGLYRLIRESYSLLGLISFLTAGPKEVRAWTIKRGTKAPEAAGKIHSDFERGFIRAEIVSFDDLMRCGGSMTAAKEAGLVRSEGKDYVMKDGDVTLFRFNV